MNLATIFSKLQEREMKLKRLVEDEESNNKKKNLRLKIEEKDCGFSDEEMTLII